ncbi:MAG: NIL domain-containing protein [Planctomycetota bacterium]
MTGPADANKRKNGRLPLKGGFLQYKGSGLFAFLQDSSEKYPIINISSRGLRFLTRDELDIGNKMTFTLGIAMLGEPIKIEGKIAWVQHSSFHNAYSVGVQFTVMTKETMTRLKNLIGFLGRKQPIKQKVKVFFSEELRNQPTLWQIARDFEVTLNILEGLLTEKTGWFTIQIEGDPDEIKRVLVHLKEKGAKLSFPKI